MCCGIKPVLFDSFLTTRLLIFSFSQGFSCPANLNTSISQPDTALAQLTKVGLEILASLAQVDYRYSEDCLTLNIWTQPQTEKAVMVWLYGGSFSSGSSSAPAYNGETLATQDVVVVTIKYVSHSTIR